MVKLHAYDGVTLPGGIWEMFFSNVADVVAFLKAEGLPQTDRRFDVILPSGEDITKLLKY